MLGLDVGPYMVSLDGSFDGSVYGGIQGLLLVYLLGYTDGKVLVSDEVITLELSDGKVLGTIPRNVYGFRVGIDVGTGLVYLSGSFDGSYYGMLEILLLLKLLGSTDIKVLGSNKSIKLRSTDVIVIGTILGNVYGIKRVLDVGKDLGSLDGSFDGSNDGNIQGLLLVESLGYTDGKCFGSDEGIQMRSTDGKVIGSDEGNKLGLSDGGFF